MEGVGTNARVCNLSYLATDWYIDQMVRPAYDSPSLPITWSRLEYCAGTNEYVTVEPEVKEELKAFYAENPEEAKKLYGDNPFELKNVLKYWVREGKDSEGTHIIPTDTLYLSIDKEAVKRSGMMMASDSIPDHMVISLKGKRALYKNDLMLLEMLANANWTRPLYVALTVGEENYMNLGDNFVQEGLVNRITPFTTNTAGAKNFDTERTYQNVMSRFKFGGLDKKGLYLDETVRRMCMTHKRLFISLATHLIQEGKDDKAKKVLTYMNKVMPAYNVPNDILAGGVELARCYTLLGMKKEAAQAIKDMWKSSMQYMRWYLSLSQNRFMQSQQECINNLYYMNSIYEIAELLDQNLGKQYAKELSMLIAAYQQKGGQLPEM